jgi:predicted SnoaL-like aldol condensation-catalyzing enzyme
MKSIKLRTSAIVFSGTLAALALLVPAAQAAAPQSEWARGGRDANAEAINKKLVGALMADIGGQADAQALGRYFAADLIQHDPMLANGRNAAVQWIDTLRRQQPAQTLTVKHMLADRDMVFVHSQLSATPANEMSGINRYDFYRLDRGVIVEHWLVSAKAPTKSKNGNSQFSNLYPNPQATSAERAETNRRLVVALSEDVFNNKKFGLLDRFWATGYLQHNPAVPSGRAALAAVIEYIAYPGSSYRVVRSVAEGDLAVVCSQNNDAGEDTSNEFGGWAVCDMYRVAGLELVEHWDVAQAVPTSSVNGNSMFSSLYRH